MKISALAKIVSLSLAAASVPQGVATAAPNDLLSRYRDGIQPGCAIGIFTESHAQFAAAGYADLDSRTPITAKTRFRIASASKQFTALAIAILAEQGRLDLDSEAAEILPEMAGALQGATIRQLLHQMGGVRDHTILIALLGIEQLGSVSRAQTLALMSRQQGGNFVPGTEIRYSNGNYLMLAEIVARVTGEDFPAFANKAIFAPLGMASTSFLDDTGVAHGYQPIDDAGGYRLADDQPATAGSGGLATTVEDLARFHADFRIGHRVWTEGVRAILLTPARLPDGTEAILPEFDAPYGGGLALRPTGGDVLIWHDGGIEGFRADYARYMNAGRGAAVLCNRVDADAHAIALEALGEQTSEVPDATAKLPPVDAPPEKTRAFAGHWRSDELDASYDITAGDRELEVVIRSSFSAEPITETWGGLRLDANDTVTSGPLRLSLRDGKLLVGFGRRVEGIAFHRVP
jgi:CubicO group peptidase (beta-lactamase class C family)